jgi:hypothetical protein
MCYDKRAACTGEIPKDAGRRPADWLIKRRSTMTESLAARIRSGTVMSEQPVSLGSRLRAAEETAQRQTAGAGSTPYVRAASRTPANIHPEILRQINGADPSYASVPEPYVWTGSTPEERAASRPTVTPEPVRSGQLDALLRTALAKTAPKVPSNPYEELLWKLNSADPSYASVPEPYQWTGSTPEERAAARSGFTPDPENAYQELLQANVHPEILRQINGTDPSHRSPAERINQIIKEVKEYDELYDAMTIGPEDFRTFRDYVDYMERAKNARQMQKTVDYFTELAEQYPVMSSLASVPMSLGGIVGFMEATKHQIRNAAAEDKQPLDVNSTAFAMSRARSAIRSTVSQSIENTSAGQLGSFVYITGMSFGDFLLAAGMGPAMAAVMLGGSAATDTLLAAKDKGASDSQAYSAGMIAGIAETVFERISLGNLQKMAMLAPDSLRAVVGNYLKSIIVNATEEGATEITNIIADSLIMGGISDYQLAVERYTRGGMSRAEAERRAAIDLAGRVGLAAAGGALAGIASATAGTSSAYVNNRFARGGAPQTAMPIPENTYQELLWQLNSAEAPLQTGLTDGTMGMDVEGAGKAKLPTNDSQLKHIFREADGHLPDTPINRTLVENTANNSKYFMGSDAYETRWYAKIQPDGSQIWVRTYNGTIINAGVNATPRTFDPQTGLNNNPLK